MLIRMCAVERTVFGQADKNVLWRRRVVLGVYRNWEVWGYRTVWELGSEKVG